MKRTIFALTIFLIAVGKIKAQVLPPDFLCVSNDTLYWELPINSCGPFVGYEIWASQNPNGPFSLQATVTNQLQDFYYFVNPSGGKWYFYLLSKYTCPGLTSIPSDTLDNRPPEVSPIQVVTIEGGQTVINWSPSPSPEVVGYIIYRQTPIGVVPVDTIYSGFSYIDLGTDPQSETVSYFVNALDPCGNISIFDAKHTSVYLEATVEPCRQSVVLTWNNYEGWVNGIAEQQIWASVNAGTLAQTADAGTSATRFEVLNITDGATYCFELRSVEAGTGVISKSNQVCLTVDVVQSAKGMYLQNVSVLGNNDVELTWYWPSNAELEEASILRSDFDADYQAIATPTLAQPLSAINNYTDQTSNAGGSNVFYRIQTIDACDSVLTSNYGSTIFLSVQPSQGNTNVLTWTPFDLENADLISYALYKIVGNSQSKIANLDPNANDYSDNFDPTNLDEAKACYFIVAKSEVVAQNGDIILQDSRSNIACSEPDARIYAPNAFVPEGFNQEFRPLIVLGDIASYEMRIHDRYGQEVFATNQPDQGWNGQRSGRNLPQGIYAYVIKIMQASGKRSEKRGTVLLIR